MPLQKSNLDNQKIREILEREYGIIPKTIRELKRGSANLFKIRTEKDMYILKEFQPRRKEEVVEKEASIIEFLKTKNINVPTYIKTKNNKNYVENEGRIIVIQKFIEGYTIGNNKGDYETVIENARILGKLTKALEEYPELWDGNVIEKNFSENSLEKGIFKMQEIQKRIKEDEIHKNRIINDLEYKINISKKLLEEFDFNNISKMTITNSHGDYCNLQLIYNIDKEPTVIDFEKAKTLPIVWEVMRSYSYIDKDSKNGEININTLVDYFKEFTKYFKLNEYDLKYASYLYAINIARSDFGYTEYIENRSMKDLLRFGLFRTKLLKNLYENREQISKRLVEEVK